MPKTESQPTDGAGPDHVAVDGAVIRPDDDRDRLYAAADPDTNRLLFVPHYPTMAQAPTEMSRFELRESAPVDAIFLVDGAPWPQAACHRLGLRFQHATPGYQNAIEHIFRELNIRTH